MIALLACAAWAGIVPPVVGARSGDPRPVLSGPEVFLDSSDGFFRVHYTLDGEDRPDGDYVGDVPVAATEAVATLVAARDHYVADGWRPLVPDEGDGGSTAIDLYLQTVDINGYSHGVPVGSETTRGSCWIEVDQSLGGTGNVFTSVVAHELHHCVQYRYTWEADRWIYEAQATYEQYRWNAEGALALAVAYLWSERLAHPERPLDTWDGRFAYAGMTFVKFWEDFQPDGRRTPALWEALEAEPRWQEAFDTAAGAAWGLSFEEAFLEYSTWMGFACARDDGTRWVADGTACAANLSAPIETVTAGESFPVTHAETPYTATYALVQADGDEGHTVDVSCDSLEAGERLGMRVVALDADGMGGEEGTGWAGPGETPGARLIYSLDPAGAALIVFASTGSRGVDTTCSVAIVNGFYEDTDQGPAPCGCTTGASPNPSALLLLGWVGVRKRQRNALARTATS